MSKTEKYFVAIDRFIAHIDTFRRPEEFEKQLAHRQNLKVEDLSSDDLVLKNLAHIIAYAHANSERVRAMMDRGDYDKIWMNYDVAKVSQLNPCEIVDAHWAQISSIMSRAKIFYVITAARTFRKIGEFAPVLDGCGIPKRIHSEDDLDKFWEGFETLKAKMKQLDIPFLKSTTSLLHLLLHLGYDCLKPDVILMRTAERLGIAKDVKSDASRRAVVRALQQYAISRDMRPAVVDMYFLIQEGQSEARTWVTEGFKPKY